MIDVKKVLGVLSESTLEEVVDDLENAVSEGETELQEALDVAQEKLKELQPQDEATE